MKEKIPLYAEEIQRRKQVNKIDTESYPAQNSNNTKYIYIYLHLIESRANVEYVRTVR